MPKYLLLLILICVLNPIKVLSQIDTCNAPNNILDSLYIWEVEDKVHGIAEKVLHAEPLFIDLIRDLGARKGEKEWNVGLGLSDNKRFDKYTTFIEYEFAPINHLGFEIEIPFSFYYKSVDTATQITTPSNKMESIKLATQYSFFVSEKLSTTLAIGYIHEFLLVDFNQYRKTENHFKGNLYNPFFVVAKRWGNNFHSLIYTGPKIESVNNHLHTVWYINTNLHYMIPGTRNFIGLEANKEMENGKLQTTIRPQLRLGVSDKLLVGIVTGYSIKNDVERFSSFIRLIYEP